MINEDFYLLLENQYDFITNDPIFYIIIRNTWVKTAYPQMLTHPDTAAFLYILSKNKNINKVLDIGTFTGFSAILFARSTSNNAIIYTIEKHKEYENLINEHIELANVKSKIKIFYDDALLRLPHINEKFDLIYVDADKINYPRYLDLCLKLLNENGVIIFDNINWYKNVESNKPDKKTKAIKELIDKVNKKSFLNNFQKLILPLGDSILILQKNQLKIK